MFDGTTQKRRVNLGGRSSKIETREQVLARTRAERELRRVQKLEVQSAIKIQVKSVPSFREQLECLPRRDVATRRAGKRAGMTACRGLRCRLTYLSHCSAVILARQTCCGHAALWAAEHVAGRIWQTRRACDPVSVSSILLSAHQPYAADCWVEPPSRLQSVYMCAWSQDSHWIVLWAHGQRCIGGRCQASAQPVLLHARG